MKSNIRSKYIKDFLADRDALKTQMNETTKESIKDMLGESVKESLRKLISEAENEDSYEEEEVDADNALTDFKPETKEPKTAEAEEGVESTEAPSEEENSNDESILDDNDEESLESEEEGEGNDGEDVWSDLEDYKDENGEYDLTGMDNDSVIRVLKIMNPETDGVRVVKSDDDNVEVVVPPTDEETEFVIDINGDAANEVDNNEDDEDELIFEANLGYTDNYQSKTAMTTLPNKEVANKKYTRSIDKGAPYGDEKRWVGKVGDMSPYSEKVNECDDKLFEIELDDNVEELDELANVNATARERGMHMTHATNEPEAYGPSKQHNVHRGGEPVDENIKLRVNSIVNENKELKDIVNTLKKRLEEAITVNYNLGKVAKLFTENTTNRNEKIEIIRRFDKVKNLNEAKALYETIDKELKNVKPSTSKENNVMQLAEAKSPITETSMYKSEEISETIDLMKRIDALRKK